MKKIIALVLALAMVLSIATTTASATFSLGSKDGSSLLGKLFNVGSIFSSDKKTALPTLNFKDILANIEKGIQGTGLVYGRDYKVTVDADDTLGYRIHLIQPVSGNTLFDNYLLYDDGAWTWEKAWNLPTLPTLDQFNLENIKNNIYTALWDSGIYVKLDQDVQVTRDSQDGFKVLIIDPLTGRTIYDKQFVIEDSKTISWKNEFEPIAEDCILAAHFPTTEEAVEQEIEEQEANIEETPVVVEETVADPVVLDDNTALAAAPAEEIANTGDAAFSAMAAITVLAGAAFVATKKHN
ncbi:MAG: hypothetical protein MJ115_03320 [Clostridia bacterium]|nr:hypothetical protein [Clostridia bacterium]